MSAIAFMTLLNRQDSLLSPHFGKAKWSTIIDAGTGETTFVRNAGLNGRSAVALLAANRCTDVVFTEIGPGALQHLQAAQIRGWFAPADTPVPRLLEKLRKGELEGATESRGAHKSRGCGEHNTYGHCVEAARDRKCAATE